MVKMTTFRTWISLAMKRGQNLYQLDMNNAFLDGDLHKKVYMELPQGITVDNNKMICKLKKTLYGLK